MTTHELSEEEWHLVQLALAFLRAFRPEETEACERLEARLLTEVWDQVHNPLEGTIMAVYGAAVTMVGPDWKPDPTYFDLLITDVTGNRLSVLREIRRQVPSMGIGDVFKLLDSLPCVVRERLWIADVKDAKKALEEVGAVVEIRASKGSV